LVPYLDDMFKGEKRQDPLLLSFLDNLNTKWDPSQYKLEMSRKTVDNIPRESRLNVGMWTDTSLHTTDGSDFLDKISSDFGITFDRDELSYMTAKADRRGEFIMLGVDIGDTNKIKLYYEFTKSRDLIDETFSRHAEFGNVSDFIINDSMMCCYEFYMDGRCILKPYLMYPPHQAIKLQAKIGPELVGAAQTSMLFYITFRNGLEGIAFIAPGQIGRIIQRLKINNITQESLPFNGIPPYTIGMYAKQAIETKELQEYNLYYMLPMEG
jgi:hypothetical protein